MSRQPYFDPTATFVLIVFVAWALVTLGMMAR